MQLFTSKRASARESKQMWVMKNSAEGAQREKNWLCKTKTQAKVKQIQMITLWFRFSWPQHSAARCRARKDEDQDRVLISFSRAADVFALPPLASPPLDNYAQNIVKDSKQSSALVKQFRLWASVPLQIMLLACEIAGDSGNMDDERVCYASRKSKCTPNEYPIKHCWLRKHFSGVVGNM